VAKIKRGGTFNGVFGEDLPHFDPHTSASSLSPHYNLIFDNLLRNKLSSWEKGTFTVEGGLAESFEPVADPALVLKLRKGVKFHDGSDWNAEVAKWNLDRIMNHPKSVSKATVTDIKEVEIIDPYTIKIKTKAPSASLPNNLTSGGTNGYNRMISKVTAEKAGGGDAGHQASGTGAFMMVSWKSGDTMITKKNPTYWEKGEDGQPLPYLDAANIRFMSDYHVQYVELKAGTLDILVRALAPDAQAARTDPNFKTWEFPWLGGRLGYGIFNNAVSGKSPLADNLKLRQAVAYSIDCDAFAKTMAMGQGGCRDTYFPPGGLGYDANITKYRVNVDKAKQLMAEAGFAQGVDIRMLLIATPQHQKAGEILQGMMAKAGFKVVLDPLERLAAIDKAKAFNFDIWPLGRVFYADPDAQCRDLCSTASGNWSGQKNLEMDKLFDEGRSTFDVKKRHEAYVKIDKMRADELRVHTVSVSPEPMFTQKYVKGLDTDWETYELRSVWLDK
jgi:ABC-type transport system substrate-binding protein